MYCFFPSSGYTPPHPAGTCLSVIRCHSTTNGDDDNRIRGNKIPLSNISAAGRAPDFIAFGITLLMTCVLALGASKSVLFNNILNTVNLASWVFIMTAGLFYVDTSTWTEHEGFLPYGWSGVSSKNTMNMIPGKSTAAARAPRDSLLQSCPSSGTPPNIQNHRLIKFIDFMLYTFLPACSYHPARVRSFFFTFSPCCVH